MTCLRRPVLMILTCLLVAQGWTGDVLAHRRDDMSLLPPVVPKISQAPAPQKDDVASPAALQPDAYLKRLLAQERTGNYQEALKTGLDLVNLFPRAPQRRAAILRLADLARGQGHAAEALEFFGLVAATDPGTPEAFQAALAAGALKLTDNLRQGNPVRALRHFLEEVSRLPEGVSPDLLRQSLRAGWQAVAQQVQATTPLPLPLVEEILTLWDMQPEGAGPAEAAQLLADLLRQNGLVEEAQVLLTKISNDHLGGQQKMLKVNGGEEPGTARDPAGSRETPALASTVLDEHKSPGPPRPSQEQAGIEPPPPAGKAGQVSLAAPAAAPMSTEQDPATTPTLLYSRPPSPPERPLAKLAPPSPGASGPKSVPTPTKPARPTGGQLGPFSQDRLGLSHLHKNQTEAAQAAFQGLAQENDPFWQSLARVRLADLELQRLQAEPAP
jgi:tetratricopeptide (TPR) repeat protein